jgi:hypothetical protein
MLGMGQTGQNERGRGAKGYCQQDGRFDHITGESGFEPFRVYINTYSGVGYCRIMCIHY